MTKRANGEGSIYRRADGRWVGSLTVGSDRRSFYGRTRAEASGLLRTAIREREENLTTPSANDSVRTYLLGWLEDRRPNVRASTWVRYEQYVRLHILPEIGAIRLSQLGPEHVQRMYLNRLKAGLSKTSVAHLHAVVHVALGQATSWGLVPRNVSDLASHPSIKRREVHALTPEEAKRLLAKAKDDRLGALYVLAVTSGMRQGELLGLRWRCISFDEGTAQVRASLRRIPGEGLVATEPKTRASRRQIALTDRAVKALRRHHKQQAEERLRAGADWQDLDYVFANARGRPTESSNLRRRSFKPLLAAAKLPPEMRFHDLRHTAATLMLSKGVHPKIVSEMLGHASIGITLDTYSHVTPTMQRSAAAAMDELLGKGGA